MNRPKRDRKQQRIDREKHYAGLAENKPPDLAVEAFIRKPYEVAPGIRELKGESVAEYMARKYDIKKGLS